MGGVFVEAAAAPGGVQVGFVPSIITKNHLVLMVESEPKIEHLFLRETIC